MNPQLSFGMHISLSQDEIDVDMKAPNVSLLLLITVLIMNCSPKKETTSESEKSTSPSEWKVDWNLGGWGSAQSSSLSIGQLRRGEKVEEGERVVSRNTEGLSHFRRPPPQPNWPLKISSKCRRGTEEEEKRVGLDFRVFRSTNSVLC